MHIFENPSGCVPSTSTKSGLAHTTLPTPSFSNHLSSPIKPDRQPRANTLNGRATVRRSRLRRGQRCIYVCNIPERPGAPSSPPALGGSDDTRVSDSLRGGGGGGGVVSAPSSSESLVSQFTSETFRRLSFSSPSPTPPLAPLADITAEPNTTGSGRSSGDVRVRGVAVRRRTRLLSCLWVRGISVCLGDRAACGVQPTYFSYDYFLPSPLLLRLYNVLFYDVSLRRVNG